MMYWGIGKGIGQRSNNFMLAARRLQWLNWSSCMLWELDMSSLLWYVLQNLELAHPCALLLHSTSRASTAHPWWVLLSMDNNCSLFAGQLIYHKRRCPKVLVPTTRTMGAELQSASSSSIHSHYNKNAVTSIAQPESGQPSQNLFFKGWVTLITKGIFSHANSFICPDFEISVFETSASTPINRMSFVVLKGMINVI